ncbi:restriction endonuclease subunit S [Aeromonas sanarellii]|uniref:restriction endonuclease subunit S n=1 Tax=Aeromonas sanarellii TaxID=633415 RepID=UPI0038D0AE18
MIAAEPKTTGQYQPYPEYKDSGVEWLGDVPTDWRVIKLGFLATKIGSGKTPSGGATVYVDDGITFLRSQNVYDDGLRLDDVVHIAPDIDMEMAHSRVKPMDILINITGASIGRTCIVPLGIGSANVNQHVCIIRLNKTELIRFVSWAVKAQSTKAQIDNAQTGAAREGLNFEQIASLLLSLPPETECEQISDFLDYETARIDRLIVQQQRLIELLKEKRQAVISHAITKGLNPDAPMKDSGIEWLGQIPDHWSVVSLKYLVQEKVAGPYGASLTKAMYTNSGYRVYGQQQVINDDFHFGDYFISEEKYAEMKRYQVFPGDVLVSVMGTIGKVAVVPNDVAAGIINPRLVRYKFSKMIKPHFVQTLMMSVNYQSRLREASQGSTMEGLNMGILGDLPMVYPCVNEQDSILEFVLEKNKNYSSTIEKAEQLVALAQERRTALISAAVTGKIDLRGWTAPAEEVVA